ncbi:LuxR C-terminal-related transcriptional regulator [Gordonibacter sp.]|uniref:LuxR C-terminal-related transcriptional regulator n=1 Tax=Gordonibacter sp. TaxID=1968902 RepID=UPI001F8B2EC8|nr:LuxR C-terminal-related transcriptional regulator [Gordonibacter sp.]HIW75832.1 LuxR C-terminal-related transcriptional regulator [Candidatus Gordonibacter avicola]
MERATKNVVDTAATRNKDLVGDPENGLVLLPLCDIAGYSCFVAWAFTVGWDKGVVPLGDSGELDFLILRCALFGGVALATCFLLFTGRLAFAGLRNKIWEALVPALCMGLAVTLFVPLPFEITLMLWFVAGAGQAATFFLWGARFKVLSHKQQLYTVCGAFAVGGLVLSVFPFVDQSVVSPTVTILPVASYGFMRLAYQRYAGRKEETAEWKAPVTFSGGVKKLREQIPFDEDRRSIILKGLFTLLYSIALGFVACAALADWLYPANGVVIGFGNAIAALIMVIVLSDRERDVCNVLPKLFLPVTSFCYLFLGILWPTEWVLICAAILFVLFGCYEILNAHTAYAYSSYDSVRCLWELYSSKAGNSVGFILGWIFATGSLYLLEADTTILLALCFFMVSIAVVIDTALFKKMKLEFHEVVVDNEPTLEVLDSKAIESVIQGKGRWSRTCDELAELYKLSPRQKEIFLLLARGRNVQFIRDELVLSTPTVKSHIYNIYQKMDIHSHQELIDLVENKVKGS